jgi:3-oxoadipate enol-lactonase
MDILANRTRFWYSESGQGQPVICIHGNGLNRDMWRHFVPALSQRSRAIVYELRGMGESETVGKPGQKFTVQDHANDLLAIMDVLQIERCALVSHAFGAFVAMQFAADHPDRVNASVLCCTSARIESATKQALPRWVETAERVGMGPLIEEAMERWFVEDFRREHPEIIDLYRRIVGANPPMGYAANCRGIIEYDVRDALPKIQCPALVITGEKDRSCPPKDHEFIAQRIPCAQLVVVPGASHTVPEEQVEIFNHTVLRFLDEHAASRG